MKKSLLAVVLLMISSLILADAMFDPARLSPNNVNLSTQKLLDALFGRDALEQEKARLYLLGVLDASEGRAWCSYQTYKTITLYEIIHRHRAELTPEQRAQRASTTLVELLARHSPCPVR